MDGSAQVLHALFLHLDAVLAPIPGLNKHNYGVSSTAFCVSAGLTEYFKGHAAAALDAALRLQEEACNVSITPGYCHSRVIHHISVFPCTLHDELLLWCSSTQVFQQTVLVKIKYRERIVPM